jgi:hypothetical protein
MPGTTVASFKSFCANTILQGREAVLMFLFTVQTGDLNTLGEFSHSQNCGWIEGMCQCSDILYICTALISCVLTGQFSWNW